MRVLILNSDLGYRMGVLTPEHLMNLCGISKNTLREALEILAQEQNFIFQWLRGYCIVGKCLKWTS